MAPVPIMEEIRSSASGSNIACLRSSLRIPCSLGVDAGIDDPTGGSVGLAHRIASV